MAKFGPRPVPAKARFWRHVDKSGDCWTWTGARKENNYGTFCVRATETRYAHRVSYEMNVGPIPAGLFVLHRCDNPPCVRPEHLFVGTQHDNLMDMSRKGRARPYDRRGEKGPNAKITAMDVLSIRAMRMAGKTLKSIGEKYGLGPSQVHRIAAKKSWLTV